MLARLLLLFVLVPLLELALLIKVGQHVGVWPTVGLVVLTGVLGASLAKQQGLLTLRQIERELEFGRIPAAQLVDGLIILIGGALLLTPGFLTDTLGLCLLLPPTRRAIGASTGLMPPAPSTSARTSRTSCSS